MHTQYYTYAYALTHTYSVKNTCIKYINTRERISDIRLGGNLTCFPVSHVYFFVGGGSKSLAKLDGGMAGLSPLSANVYTFMCTYLSYIHTCTLYTSIYTYLGPYTYLHTHIYTYIHTSGSQPFQIHEPLRKFCLGSRTTTKKLIYLSSQI